MMPGRCPVRACSSTVVSAQSSALATASTLSSSSVNCVVMFFSLCHEKTASVGGCVVGLVKVGDGCAPVVALAATSAGHGLLRSYRQLHLWRGGLEKVVQAPLQIRQCAFIVQLARTIAHSHQLPVSHVWRRWVARRLWP